MSTDDLSATLDRRHFLRGALVMGAALATDHWGLTGDADARARAHRWSDRRTWGGRVPGRKSVVQITKPVLLDRDVRVAGVNIKPGGALIFHPNRQITLSTSGNVIVNGLLRMRPSGPRVRHRLKFVGVKERRFKGGGMSPLRRDVGLWVMGGVLDLDGSNKRAWTRAAGGISKGTKGIELRNGPVGWRVGDRIAITPTLPPSNERHEEAFDEATITGISGRTIRLSRATRYEHPKVEVRPNHVLTAEVLNLTRNVVIQGTPRGRAHIKITSHKQQSIRNVDVRYMGPRRKSGEFTAKILGRWPLHFHHAGHGSHGSIVRGVVVRDSGSHAFVAHKSHGVLFKSCIAYNNLETPYWWDEPARKDRSLTNSIVYDSCVAARINTDPGYRGGSDLMGFKMAQGKRNKVVNCVAVGVLGQKAGSSSGFGWLANQWGVWGFKNCVAHNNKNLGTRTWLNAPAPQRIDGLVAYHNGRFGSADGAYKNGIRYFDCVYYRNGQDAAIIAAATSGKGVPRKRRKAFIRLRIDQGGAKDYCIDFTSHVNDPRGERIVVKDCHFRGYKKAAIAFTHQVSRSTNVPDLVDVVDCSFSGNEFWLGSQIHPDSRIRVQDSEHGAIQLARWDQLLEGILVPEWNARMKPIPRFA